MRISLCEEQYGDMAEYLPIESRDSESRRANCMEGPMFLNVVSSSSEDSAETGRPIAPTRDATPLFLRPDGWLRRLVGWMAAHVVDTAVDRRLRNSRWCDSTERALHDDSAARR